MITMDGKYSLEDFGLRATDEHEHPAVPEIQNKTMPIPGMVGRWDFGSELRAKHLPIPLRSLNIDHMDLQRRLNDFVAFLFDPFGKPREIKIVYDYEPDKFYTVKVSDQFSPERVRPFSRFVLPLVANKPRKKLNFENHEINWDSTTATFDDSWSIDTAFVDDQVITSNTTVETYVNGLAIRPDIHISGTGKNVTFKANGKTFALKDFTDAVFLIRGSDYTCFKDGVENLTEMEGDHLTLLPNSNEIDITGDDMNFYLSIKIRDQYN